MFKAAILGTWIRKRYRRLLLQCVLLLLFEVKRVNGLESAKEERMKHIYGEVTRSELSAQSSSLLRPREEGT